MKNTNYAIANTTNEIENIRVKSYRKVKISSAPVESKEMPKKLVIKREDFTRRDGLRKDVTEILWRGIPVDYINRAQMMKGGLSKEEMKAVLAMRVEEAIDRLLRGTPMSFIVKIYRGVSSSRGGYALKVFANGVEYKSVLLPGHSRGYRDVSEQKEDNGITADGETKYRYEKVKSVLENRYGIVLPNTSELNFVVKNGKRVATLLYVVKTLAVSTAQYRCAIAKTGDNTYIANVASSDSRRAMKKSEPQFIRDGWLVLKNDTKDYSDGYAGSMSYSSEDNVYCQIIDAKGGYFPISSTSIAKKIWQKTVQPA